jgi:hypothetical protein
MGSKLIAFTLSMLVMVATEVATQAAEPDAASKNVTSLKPPVERASADDCAIIVAVGKNRMNWGAAPPNYAYYREFDSDGGGTYLEDCSWQQLGVAEPLTKVQQPEKGFSITRPRYTGASATVELQIFISEQIVDGKRTPPFISVETCSLERQGGRWQFRECNLRLIT